MSTEAKHSGAWRTLNGIEVKHSGSWRTIATVEVKHGGVWRTVFSGAPTVSLSAANVSWSYDFTTYAIVRYGTNGLEYKNATATTTTTTGARGTWLTSGSSSGAWASRVINSGSLNWVDGMPGGSRYQMNSDRQVGVRDTNSAAGGVTCNLTVSMHDASSGGNLLDSATFSLSATYYNACPFCCFTPDTLILMASGLQMPIGKIKEGDEIVVFDVIKRENKVEKVGEVITRENRTMHEVQFEDGTVLKASDDHPLHVEEKGGPASINPLYEYKDLGIPDQLMVGDIVSRPDGSRSAVTAIRGLDYPGTVFTFSNSLFYANGLLVY